MTSEQWKVVYETGGEFQADILVAMLEAEGIPTFISQEGAGRVYGLTIGRLGRVQVLVPNSELARAENVVRQFEIGTLETDDDFPDEPGSINPDQEPNLSDQEN